MKKFLKKSLIYLIMTVLALPVSVIIGYSGAEKAKASVTENPSIVSEIIDNPVISPDEDGLKDEAKITLGFSEPVIADLDIIDSEGDIVKNIYNSGGMVTNPQDKYWHGEDDEDQDVADGVYIVRVSYEDSYGHSMVDTSKTITVDTMTPVTTITRTPDQDISTGYIFTVSSSELSAEIKYSWDQMNWVDYVEPVEKSNVGNYWFFAKSTDLAGNESQIAAISFQIIEDTNDPEIILNGPDFLVIGDNSEYVEQGATAIDQEDGDITVERVITDWMYTPVENIDTELPGIYWVSYTATDRAGNEAVEMRLVSVQPVSNAWVNLNGLFVDEDGAILENLRADFQRNRELLISLYLENGSAISGDDWNGIFNLPGPAELSGVTLPAENGYIATDVSGYEIGAGAKDLMVDRPAKLVFYGKAGYKVGYVNEPGAFTSIVDQCVIDEGATTPVLVADSACKIDVGSDLVVWTTHFTKFVTYAESSVVAPTFTASTLIKDSIKYVRVEWASTGADKYSVTINGTEFFVPAVEGQLSYVFEKAVDFGKFEVLVRSIKSSVYSSNQTAEIVEFVKPVVVPAVTTPTETQAETPAQAVSPVAPQRAQAAVQPEPSPEQTVETPKDEGIIKGDEDTDEDDKTNWTPWIILFILIILAGAATGGYFYWFAGKDEESVEPKKKDTPKEKVSVTVREQKKPSNKKPKRW